MNPTTYILYIKFSLVRVNGIKRKALNWIKLDAELNFLIRTENDFFVGGGGGYLARFTNLEVKTQTEFLPLKFLKFPE